MTDEELIEQVEKMKARIAVLDSDNRILVKRNEELKKENKLLKKQLKEAKIIKTDNESLKLFK